MIFFIKTHSLNFLIKIFQKSTKKINQTNKQKKKKRKQTKKKKKNHTHKDKKQQHKKGKKKEEEIRNKIEKIHIPEKCLNMILKRLQHLQRFQD